MTDLISVGTLIREIGVPAAVIAVLFFDMLVERKRMARRFEAAIERATRQFENALEKFSEVLERQEQRYSKGRDEAMQRILERLDRSRRSS